jgi:N utilization substance protein A
VLSDTERQVITAIVDEDQLSLAIGRNGQNVRLASQLIGWQIDLYGSREWLERGADLSLFQDDPQDDQYETADFPLSELDLRPPTLAALSEAGYDTFLQIIDLDRRDFLGLEGIGEEDADHLLKLIDELTVVEGEAAPASGEPDASEPSASDDEGNEGEEDGSASTDSDDDENESDD